MYKQSADGKVCGCIGFVKDRHTRLNVPNTLLKKDIRDVTASPKQKVYAVFSKNYSDKKYSTLEKLDRSIDLNEYLFSNELETLIDRTNF